MKKNEKLIQSLQDINHELASFYESAYQILHHTNIQNKLQTAAYCLRELLCRLPNHFDSSLIKPRKKISNKIFTMIELWENLNIKNCLDISSEIQWKSEQISAIKIFLDQFNQLVETDREIQRARKEYAIQFIHRQNEKYSLEHLPDNHMDYLGKIFYEFLDYFNRVLHGPYLGISENEFKENFTKLESYLIGILEPNVKETHTKIDAIIEKKKTPDVNHVNNVMSLIHNKVSYDYFFSRLNSPIWLEPLKNAGIFNNPPNIEQHDEWIRIPTWGPSRYLVSIAKKAPKETAKIIMAIPDNNNLKVYEDYINAAIEMPLNEAKTIIKKVTRFLDNTYSFNFSNKLCELVIFLLKEKCSERAFKICYRLFDIQDSGDNYNRYKHFFTNNWEYNEKLTLIYSHLEEPQEKLQFFRLICIQLRNCIEYDSIDKNTFVDYSSSWRQEIHKSHHVDDIKNTLTDWLIKISEELILSHKEEIFSILVEQPYPVFIRIKLYLLHDKLDAIDHIFEILQEEKYIKSIDVWHEYAILLQKTFPHLKQKKQKLFLNFISKIKPRDKEEQNEFIKYRVYYLIKDYLKGKTKKDFEVMRQNHGDIAEPTFLVYFYSSSVSLEDLKPISLDSVVTKNNFC